MCFWEFLRRGRRAEMSEGQAGCKRPSAPQEHPTRKTTLGLRLCAVHLSNRIEMLRCLDSDKQRQRQGFDRTGPRGCSQLPHTPSPRHHLQCSPVPVPERFVRHAHTCLDLGRVRAHVGGRVGLSVLCLSVSASTRRTPARARMHAHHSHARTHTRVRTSARCDAQVRRK